MLREYRPLDTVVEAAASDSEGTVVLNRFQNTGLSTISPEFATLANKRGFVADERKTVPAVTLSHLLSEHRIDEVHFLSIDVEGWELHVLRGAQLSALRPWIICIEAITPGTDEYCGDEAKVFIEAAGYTSALFDGVNDWFVADERHSLLPDVRVGFSAVDRGMHGWRLHETVELEKAKLELEAQQTRMRVDLDRAVEETARLTEDAERASSEWNSERASLVDRRALVHSVRQVAPQRPTPLDHQGESHHPHDSHSGPAPALASSPSRTRALRRLVKALVPRSIVSAVRTQQALRRFVPIYTAPSFVDGPGDTSRGVNDGDTDTPFPPELLQFEQLPQSALPRVQSYLREHPHDSDSALDARLDGMGDIVGAMLTDIRSSASIASMPSREQHVSGSEILFDARALQSAGYRDRGIGVFARSLLEAARQANKHARLTMLIDPFEAPLSEDIAQGAELISSVASGDIERFGLFLQPSPMTHDVAPLLPILAGGTRSAVVVYDFIPADYPDVYLSAASARLRYATQMRALSKYDHFLPISSAVESALLRWIPDAAGKTIASWPADLTNPVGSASLVSPPPHHVVVFGANEPRKNTLAALAGLAHVNRSRKSPLKVVILGLSGQETLALHWADLAGLELSQVSVAPRVSEQEKHRLLTEASLVLVPSFAEGLSLPVIEALSAGTAIVASDIDVHRELLGSGPHLAHPARAEQWASAIRRALRKGPELARAQSAGFQSQRKATHDAVVAGLVEGITAPQHQREGENDESGADGSSRRADVVSRSSKPARLSIGIASPWPHQKTGVADYSLTTLTALADVADVTVYVTSGADRAGTVQLRDVSEAYDAHDKHDAFISVLGNSSFHLPIMRLAHSIGGLTLCHDSRMVEYYLALEGEARTAHLMGMSDAPRGQRTTLARQLERGDYENLGMAEIASFSSVMLFHSHAAGLRVRRETGGVADDIPFVPLRQPDSGEELDAVRSHARTARRFQDDVIHIVSLGVVDSRMKLHDHLFEAVMWVRSWGLQAHLHFVGSDRADSVAVNDMKKRSRQSGDNWFHVTGYVADHVLREYLSGADLLVQLRAGAVPMMSAPVADAAAFGTPTLASPVLMEDEALPSYISSTDPVVSPLLLAEKIMELVSTPVDPAEREHSRRGYVEVRNPQRYAAELVERIEAHR